MFRPTPACFQLHGRENVRHPRKKIFDSPILIEKNFSRRRPGKMSCRCLKKNHHRMTSIEHFLIDIIQILFRDWIENTIADIGRCKTATDIFRPTLRNFVYKRRPIIFFYGRGFSFVGCCRKNLQCRSARFFRVRSTEVFFQPTPPCFHLLGKHNICPPRKKALLTDTDKKKILADIGKEGEQIPVQKKNHLVKSIKHFLIDIIQILFRDWIVKTTANISR